MTARAAQPPPPPMPAASVRRSTYVEAVGVYERGLEALQRHDYRAATELFETVLRQYPEEKELHERVRLYLNICQRQTSRREPAPQTIEERSVRVHDCDQRRTLRRGPCRNCTWFATRIPTTITPSTCWPSHTPSGASSSRRSHTCCGPSPSTLKIAASRNTTPISSRSEPTKHFARRSTPRACPAAIAAVRFGPDR